MQKSWYSLDTNANHGLSVVCNHHDYNDTPSQLMSHVTVFDESEEKNLLPEF